MEKTILILGKCEKEISVLQMQYNSNSNRKVIESDNLHLNKMHLKKMHGTS